MSPVIRMGLGSDLDPCVSVFTGMDAPRVSTHPPVRYLGLSRSCSVFHESWDSPSSLSGDSGSPPFSRPSRYTSTVTEPIWNSLLLCLYPLFPYGPPPFSYSVPCLTPPNPPSHFWSRVGTLVSTLALRVHGSRLVRLRVLPADHTRASVPQT